MLRVSIFVKPPNSPMIPMVTKCNKVQGNICCNNSPIIPMVTKCKEIFAALTPPEK